MADYAARGQDGYLRKSSATSYADAQAATPTVEVAGATMEVGQTYNAGTYYINRGYLSFDTSTFSVPDGQEVVSASANYYIPTDGSDTDFDLVLAYGTQPTWGGTLANTDWGSGNVSTTVMRNTSGISAYTLYSAAVPTASLKAGGYTEYEIKSSREGTAPTGNETVSIATANNATYKPYLTITLAPLPNEDSMDQDGACVVLFIV